MKAITAAVIAILNVNIRFRPQVGRKKRRNYNGEEALGGRLSVGSLKRTTTTRAPRARDSTLLTLAKLRL
jgi:hypothetical protein